MESRPRKKRKGKEAWKWAMRAFTGSLAITPSAGRRRPDRRWRSGVLPQEQELGKERLGREFHSQLERPTEQEVKTRSLEMGDVGKNWAMIVDSGFRGWWLFP